MNPCTAAIICVVILVNAILLSVAPAVGALTLILTGWIVLSSRSAGKQRRSAAQAEHRRIYGF